MALVVVLIRTLIVYTILILSMRIMGKRQIGQLDVTDLITTLLLSEIATLPIENPDIPIANAIIPIITILTFEVTSSTILSRTPRLKNLFSSRPGFLIQRGRINQKEMLRNRISTDELMSELRRNNAADISDVAYAIIEQDGKITVIPSRGELSHILISCGVINRHGLAVIGKDIKWLESRLGRGRRAKDVYLMTINDSGKINIIMKEK